MEENREKAIKIIDVFEELLKKYSIKLPSEDREKQENEASIYGDDYYKLEDEIVEILGCSL